LRLPGFWLGGLIRIELQTELAGLARFAHEGSSPVLEGLPPMVMACAQPRIHEP
jgi:hypothetical protein